LSTILGVIRKVIKKEHPSIRRVGPHTAPGSGRLKYRVKPGYSEAADI
jgi:hypothetical protein